MAHLSSVLVLALATAASHAAGRRGVEPPPNAPAAIEWELQVFAIREARPHPWVLSTTRHISQGGVSLLDERWDRDGNVLSGKSAVVTGDPYVLSVHVPAGYRLKSAEVSGEKVETRVEAPVASIRIVPSATKADVRRIQNLST